MPRRVVEVASPISTSTKLAGASPANRPVKLTIVFRRVRPRSSVESVREWPSTRTSSTRPTRASLRVARGLLGQLDEALHALDLHLVRDLVGHRRRVGPRPRRIDEGERAVVSDLGNHLERGLEVLFGLAGEADDDVRAEREIRNRRAKLLDERQVALAANTSGASP